MFDESSLSGHGQGFCEVPPGGTSGGCLRTDSGRLVAKGNHQPAPLMRGLMDSRPLWPWRGHAGVSPGKTALAPTSRHPSFTAKQQKGTSRWLLPATSPRESSELFSASQMHAAGEGSRE